MRSLQQDLRLALRSVRSAPLPSLIAVTLLAVAVGANTAVFSVVEAVLLRPLPGPHSDRLAEVRQAPGRAERLSGRGSTLSLYAAEALRGDVRSFEEATFYAREEPTLTGAGRPGRILTTIAPSSFFRTLGARPLVGRLFSPEDDSPAAGPVVVLSAAFWASRFGNNRAIVGHTLTFDGEPAVVIGVVALPFDFPEQTPIWRNLGASVGSFEAAQRMPAGRFRMLGRLRNDVDWASLETELAIVSARLWAGDSRYANTVAIARPLRDQMVGGARRPLTLVYLASLLLVLIACANLGNLMLSRAFARERENAVRLALGATGTRLARQWLTESLLLAIIGAAAGTVLALWGVPTILAVAGSDLPFLPEVEPNWRVLASAVAMAIASGLLFGAAPAIWAARQEFTGVLRTGMSAAGSGSWRPAVRDGLVVAQLALTVVLLAGAALLGRSVWNLLNEKLGFDREGVLVAHLSLPPVRYATPETRQQFVERLLKRVKSMPGVVTASISTGIPFNGGAVTTAAAEGILGGPSPRATAVTAVSPDYFRVFGIPLTQGEAWNRDGGNAVLVNQEFVRQYMMGTNPVGRLVRYFDTEQGRVLGVVGSTLETSLDGGLTPQVYELYSRRRSGDLWLSARVTGRPARFVDGLRTVVNQVDPELAVEKLMPMEGVVLQSIASRRFFSLVLVYFAAAGLGIAAAGVFSVATVAATQRRREIGIRLAIGAPRSAILSMMSRRALLVTALGIGLGGAVARAATPLLKDMLYAVAPGDARLFGLAIAVVGMTAIFAAILPAHRACRTDPTLALRE